MAMRIFYALMSCSLKIVGNVEKRDGIGNGKPRRSNVNRTEKKMWVLRFLFWRRNEQPVFTHFIAVKLGASQYIGATLKETDVRDCLEELVKVGLCERCPVGDSIAYKISEKGVTWYTNHGEEMMIIL
jgi:hypothetical protein